MQMWEHYCPVEKSAMAIGKGETCNWCGQWERDEKVVVKKPESERKP